MWWLLSAEESRSSRGRSESGPVGLSGSGPPAISAGVNAGPGLTSTHDASAVEDRARPVGPPPGDPCLRGSPDGNRDTGRTSMLRRAGPA